MKKRSIIACVLIMAMAMTTVFAADAAQLYETFSLDARQGNVDKAISTFDELNEKVKFETDIAKAELKTAFRANDMLKYYDAYSKLDTLGSYYMTMPESQALLKAILAEDEPHRTDNAQWLYKNSTYYAPTLTLDYSVAGDGFAFTYAVNLTTMPGSDIMLPVHDATVDSSYLNGELLGWGLTPNELTYKSGETIPMPLTNHTFYAQWKPFVVFDDAVTLTNRTYDNVTDGQAVDVPTLKAPNQSYYFMGWKNIITGKVLPADTTSYTVVGKGAAFDAMWENASIIELLVQYYDAQAIPANTQLNMGFYVTNNGTQDLTGLKATMTTTSADATVIDGTLTVGTLAAGNTYSITGFKMLVKDGTASGTQVPVTFTLTDADNHSWSQSYTMLVK